MGRGSLSVTVSAATPVGWRGDGTGLYPDASACSLHTFVLASIDAGSVVHTDGWEGYSGIEEFGYKRKVTVLAGRKKKPHELLPRVHRVASLLKRWILGTHQGSVSHEHLGYYLDEFTFRFNRRRSRARGLLFYRLLQQAVNVEPVPYRRLVGGKPQADTTGGG